MDALTLERLMADALSNRVDVRVAESTQRRNRFRATLQSVPAEVEWLGVGWPRQVRELLAGPNPPDLVVAPELSPGAVALLRDANVSWVDLRGAADIHLNGLVVLLDGDLKSAAPKLNPSWTPGALAVCEALLVGVPGTVASINQATGLSTSTASTALKFLQSEGLVSAEAARGRNARRVIVDPIALLESYAVAARRLRSPEYLRVGVLWRNPAQGATALGSRLTDARVAWCTTSALAADTLAPYLTEVDPWEMYVDGRSVAALRQIARDVGLHEDKGGRLLLRPFPTPARDVLSTVVNGQQAAAWPRVFADLRMIGVRGEEAAEHLLETLGAIR